MRQSSFLACSLNKSQVEHFDQLCWPLDSHWNQPFFSLADDELPFIFSIPINLLQDVPCQESQVCLGGVSLFWQSLRLIESLYDTLVRKIASNDEVFQEILTTGLPESSWILAIDQGLEWWLNCSWNGSLLLLWLWIVFLHSTASSRGSQLLIRVFFWIILKLVVFFILSWPLVRFTELNLRLIHLPCHRVFFL